VTRDETIKLAMKAGLLDKVDCSDDYFIPGDAFVDEIEAFAKLVAEAERETCADICDQHSTCEGIAQNCATAIRERGESK
jgi:hypothetical protein